MAGAVLFALLLTAAVVGVGYIVAARRFHQTPEYVWRKRVFDRSSSLAEERRRLVANAARSPDEVLDEERRSAKEAAHNEITLDRLMEFSGIGPGTVGLLRESGVRNIPAILRTKLGAINGIGPQKAALLWSASRNIVAECDAAFDAGRSPQGAAFAECAPVIQTSAKKAYDEYQAALASIDAAISAHRDSERLATQVSLVGYLQNRIIAGLDAKRMQQPFPTVATPSPTFRMTPSTNSDLLQERLRESPPAAKVEPPRRHPQLDRLEAFARFGVLIAFADGRAAQAELRLVRIFLAELFGHEPDLLRRIDPLVELSTATKPFVDHTIAEAKRVAKDNAELTRLYQWAVQITDASSGRNEREAALLDRVAKAWNLAAAMAPTSKPEAASPEPSPATSVAEPTPTDPRSELGIPADAEITVELVRRRYALVVDQLVASRLDGLGEEFTKLAAIKRNKVEAAANALLTPFGEPLEPRAEPPPTDLRHNPDLDAVFGA